jgi:hypothetical protein
MLTVEVFLATHVLGTFRMSFFKVGPTELRILLAIGNTVALWKPNVRRIWPGVSVLRRLAALSERLGWCHPRALGNLEHEKLYRLEPMPTESR